MLARAVGPEPHISEEFPVDIIHGEVFERPIVYVDRTEISDLGKVRMRYLCKERDLGVESALEYILGRRDVLSRVEDFNRAFHALIQGTIDDTRPPATKGLGNSPFHEVTIAVDDLVIRITW